MLKPLKQFFCDTCGQLIENPEDGYVEWISLFQDNGTVLSKDFRIVHHQPKSPYTHIPSGCYNHDSKIGRSDLDLKTFLQYKHQYIFSFLNRGFLQDPNGELPSEIEDYAAFVNFCRRVTIPYYEEARFYFDEALGDPCFNSCNEIRLFHEDILKSIINTFSE
ncbi:MAG: hypothetical protein H6Q13_2748 [Bacteroidetes bacterium]|jgi:hypothetical protein|nr:hypothetical protein [Bacteroidota bacterium]